MSNLGNKFRSFSASLQNIYPVEESNAITSLVFEEILQLNRIGRKMEQEKRLHSRELETLDLVLNRLLSEEPVQHVLGFSWFMSHKYLVNQHVLIPRPETEELVSWILRSKKNPGSRILDVGTGSGCIAVELKSALPDAQVTAVDISEKALHIARVNAVSILGDQSVRFMVMDILEESEGFPGENFDIIVSNPPYITQAEKSGMSHNVLGFEPHSALFVDDKTPLLFYESIADLAMQKLSDNGVLYFEINGKFGKKTCDMLSEKGFTSVELRKDMQGKDRMIRAFRR